MDISHTKKSKIFGATKSKDLVGIQQTKPIQELLDFSIINVDKPSHITSFGVVDRIRHIFDIKRVGHFGTLDLKVTGVLPIALGRACKLCEYFMHHDKVYVGKMWVHAEIKEDKLRKEMKKFVGKIMQKPPVKSAVKRVLRPRTVNKFEITGIDGKAVSFIADVEAGTYIRKLISDLGEGIGGAHMIELRRLRAGLFEEKDSHTLEEITKAFEAWKEKGDESKLRKILIPAEIISEILPIYELNGENLKYILNGIPIRDEHFIKQPKEDLIMVFFKDRFIGIFEKSDDGFKAKVIFNQTSE